MHSLFVYLFSLLVGTLTIATAILITDVYKWLYLPRGPLPLPFIGNKLSLPRGQAWLQFDKWAKEYGPIYTIWIGRTPTLIVTKPVVAHELLSLTTFSNRPRSVVFGELYMKMASLITLQYGKAFTIRRTMFHQALKTTALQLYKPRQEAEASLLASDMLNDGRKNWIKIIDRYTAGVITTTAFGRRIESMDAEVIKQKLEYMNYGINLFILGRYWAETLPFLKMIPSFLAPWKRVVEKKGDEQAAFNVSLLNLVRSDIKKASVFTDTESLEPKQRISTFTEQTLDMQNTKDLVLDDRSLAALGSEFFTAGFDTTASTLGSCLLALILNPEVLRRAQSELDKALPCISSAFTVARSPTFADLPEVPYTYALVLETLRWRPVAPLGLPHASAVSCTYGTFTIPKGTTVIASTWSLNHDPATYPSPSTFAPERFLPSKHEKYDPKLVGEAHPLKSRLSSFGWGRRACPGEQFAVNTLFIGIAKLLWGFNITGVKGEVIDTMDYQGGSLVRPPKFEVVFEARSPAHRLVMEKEAKEAGDFMQAFDKID